MTEAEKKAEDWIAYFGKCGLGMADLKNVQKYDGDTVLQIVLKKLKATSAAELVKACNR